MWLIEPRRFRAEYSGLIAAPGTPNAQTTPSLSRTRTAASIARILATTSSLNCGSTLRQMRVRQNALYANSIIPFWHPPKKRRSARYGGVDGSAQHPPKIAMRRRKRPGRWLGRLRCALVRTAAKSTPPYAANWARSSAGSKHKPLKRLGNAKLPQLSADKIGRHAAFDPVNRGHGALPHTGSRFVPRSTFRCPYFKSDPSITDCGSILFAG
jgi:hypothetical protein